MFVVVPVIEIYFSNLETADDVHDSEVLACVDIDISDVGVQRDYKGCLSDSQEVYVLNAITLVEDKLIELVKGWFQKWTAPRDEGQRLALKELQFAISRFIYEHRCLNFELVRQVLDKSVQVIEVFLAFVFHALFQLNEQVKRNFVFFLGFVQNIQFSFILRIFAVVTGHYACKRAICKGE